MKSILCLIATLILATAAFGQCTLPIEKAPNLSGVYLGMSAADVITRFGKPFFRDEQGFGYIYEFPDTSGPVMHILKPTNFDGLSQLELTVTDGTVTNILITYKPETVKWDSTSEFAAALSEKLSLPMSWAFKGDRADLWCGSFVMTAEAAERRIILSDLAPIAKKVNDDRNAGAEKKKAFKP